MTPDVDFEAWSSDRILRWCEGLTEANAPRSCNWWMSVRRIAQRRAYDSESPVDVRREWAATVNALTDYAARFAGLNRWTAASDICTMRAYGIEKLGQESEIEPLIAFVLATLTLDPETARDLAQRWTTLPTEQILLLRQHKNLITPLMTIAARHPESAIQPWIEIHTILP